jgi:hypothetical protein
MKPAHTRLITYTLTHVHSLKTDGTARRRLLGLEQAIATWSDWQTAYPKALLDSGEAPRSSTGHADTTPEERGVFWHLYNAQRNGAGRYIEFVQAARSAAGIASATGVQSY